MAFAVPVALPGDGKGFAPVALATEGCIAHPIVDLAGTDAFLFQFPDGDDDGIFHDQAVQEIAVLQDGIFGGVSLESVE